MATTSMMVPFDLWEKAVEKSGKTGISVHNVISLGVKKWVSGEWFPKPGVLTTPKPMKVTIIIPDDIFVAAVTQRKQTGQTTSSIYRRAIEKWVSGEWEVDLVSR